jgi:transducin (beta)-like 1
MRRKRQTNQHMNGDGMDVDDSYGQSDQISDTDSPAPAVGEVPLLDTLAITEDRLVSTESPRDLLPNTSFLDIPPKSIINYALWSSEGPALLVGGTNCLRIYGIKGDTSARAVSRDVALGSLSFEVISLSWLGEANAVACITGELDSDNDITETSSRLIHITNWGVKAETFGLLSGVVFSIKYNSTSKTLLTISSKNLTTLSIFRVESDSIIPLCSKELHDSELYDAAWMTPTKFIACGTNVHQIYEVVTIDSTKAYEIRHVQTHDSNKAWYRLKYDPICEIAAMIDQESSVLRQYNIASEDTRTQAFDHKITDFAFQPLPNPSAYSPPTPRLLATSTNDGIVRLWNALNPFECLHKLSVPDHIITMSSISFSPDGFYLAGAGFNTVAVWKPEDGGQPKALWRCTDQEVWRSLPQNTEDEQWVHGLGWEGDGHMLAYMLEDQVCVFHLSRRLQLANGL